LRRAVGISCAWSSVALERRSGGRLRLRIYGLVLREDARRDRNRLGRLRRFSSQN
jgi:hypothetical protein